MKSAEITSVDRQKHTRPAKWPGVYGNQGLLRESCAGRNRTYDLQVMSLAS